MIYQQKIHHIRMVWQKIAKILRGLDEGDDPGTMLDKSVKAENIDKIAALEKDISPQAAEDKLSLTRYTQNRELSWLKFDQRVLDEAEDESVPLLERAKFVEIFTSNLDEFFMVRVGSLFTLESMDKKKLDTKSLMTAREQINAVFAVCRELYARRDRVVGHLRRQLMERGIGHLTMQELSKKQYSDVENIFKNSILPVLSPQIIDKHHPFPHLDNKKLYVAAVLKGKKKHIFGIIPLPDMLGRLVYLSKDKMEFVLMEDVIGEFIDRVFVGYPILDKSVFTITRNADINLEDEEVESGDLLEAMTAALKKRKHLTPVRVEIQSRGKSLIAEYLTDRYKIGTDQVFYSVTPLSLGYVYGLGDNLTDSLKQELLYPPFEPKPLEAKLNLEPETRLMDHVKQQDVLLKYPYDDFGIFLQLLKEAVYDPDVLSIRITIYRIGRGHVKLMNYLMTAAEDGKDVTVLLELKARFDEENNISWVSGLREAGCKILYGFDRYKVHAKLCLITYRDPEGQGVKYLTHIGTGNFNAKTARLYTDFSLLTADPGIGSDAAIFFRNMGIGNLWGEYQHLLVAPVNLKTKMLELIERETKISEAGGEGRILLKMNSFTDRDLIDALYRAGQAGVRVDMIVRGITCLVPERPGLTENIHIRSIVGRFLEHPRVFCFGHEDNLDMYIASADWMTRNTEHRVEVATPIYAPEIKKEIWDYLQLQLADNTKARAINAEGEYYELHAEGRAVNAQEILLNS